MVAGWAVLVLGVAYALALAAGFLSLDDPARPIGDPWFTLLECLILAISPALVALMVAVHRAAPAEDKALSRAALIFMALTAALTVCLHAAILALRHLGGMQGTRWTELLTFRWPSFAYVTDILAWDVFFALSMFCAAPVFRGSRLERSIRLLLLASGGLAAAGLSGPVLGDMRVRNIGIVGYAGVFPLAAALMAVWFSRTLPQASAPRSASAAPPL